MQNVDWEGHPEFVEGVGKLTHIFRQAQYDHTRFGSVTLSEAEGVEMIFTTVISNEMKREIYFNE